MNPMLKTLAVTFSVLGMAFSATAGGPPAVGAPLPDFTLPVPADPQHREYLGLDPGGTFTIPGVRATAVIVQIFSMYCPHCQREAPVVNRLFEKLTADPRTRGKVKLIGIGVGNSEFEIEHFRKTYKIGFPLFADADFHIHKLIGEVRTPYFIGVRTMPDGSQSVFYSHLGSFGTP